ncbi:hypothetical protein [Shinella oryzae]|uniref:hypothetical protein n=1 Tax=Shinella oryzae TaxID=2871820 RepID=UPI001FF11B00|nr:hypothetical protein [Shinella oryzae]
MVESKFALQLVKKSDSIAYCKLLKQLAWGRGTEVAISYKDCNSALNNVFFDGRHAGQPVYLTLDNDMRDEVAGQLGVEPGSVEEAICRRVGNWLERRGNPYDTMLDAVELWKRAGMKSQPYFTAVLFCLSHAATIMAAEGEFAASNYYVRLSQVTGIEKQRLSQHGNATDLFWNALRDWLLLNNFSLGKPTAVAATTWKYVGKAISQAVVRASDRELFQDLFERYGFSGSESISLKEMEFYLSHWIVGSKANSRLRGAWGSVELRERVVEAALAQLSKWSRGDTGTTAGTLASAGNMRLSLLANFVQRFPRQALELHLGRMAADDSAGPFQMGGESSEFFLASDRFGGYSTLSPSPLGRGIGSRFHLVGAVPGLRPLDWQPRLVIPLVRSTQENLWAEVAKVSFGAPHVVLVRDAHGLPSKVESYLAAAAMKMPEKASPAELPGLPPGWILYKDVQVRQPDRVPGDDLECLVPWSNDGVLSVSGGIQLLPGFYHASKPVSVHFLSSTGPTRIEAWTNGAPPRLLCHVEAAGNECEAKLDAAELGFSDGITLRAFQGGKEAATCEAYFRDADAPRPLNREGKGRLAYASVVSATPARASVSEGMVSGMESGEQVPPVAWSPIDAPGMLPVGSHEEEQQPVAGASPVHRASSETCIERGYHYWICETLPPGRPRNTPLEQRCKGCGTMIVMLHRGTAQATGALPVLPIPISRISQAKPTREDPIDADGFLDALCFLGSGSWGRFQALSGLGNEPTSTSPRQVAQDLSLLGFLDLELIAGSNAVKSWCVPRTSVNFVDDRKAFLSGFRSPRLVEAIMHATQESGGRAYQENLAGRPQAIWLEAIDIMSAKAAFRGIVDPLGRGIAVLQHPGSLLAGAFASLDGISSILRTVSIGRPAGLQSFDVRNARWRDARLASHPGAYRWNEGYQQYAYVAPGGSAWAGPYQIVKVLAARDEGTALWQYDKLRRTFRATLGCDPPGLLGRALVASTGYLPSIEQGTVSYANITPNVASSVLAAIYTENLDEGHHRRSQSG